MENLSVLDEMEAGIVELCGPRSWNDNRESWLQEGADAAGISFRAARAFFYRESENPGGRNVDKVRAALARKKEEKARDELGTLVERLGTLLAMLETVDSDFHGPALLALGDMADRLSVSINPRGDEDRAVD